MLKKQLIKFVISLIITSIIFYVIIILPPKNEAEMSVQIKVNDNITMLSKINRDFAMEHNGGFVVLEERDTIDKLKNNKEIIKNCNLILINNKYLMSLSQPVGNTYVFNFVVDRAADQAKCSEVILNLFNKIGLSKIKSYLTLLELSEDYSTDINDIDLNTTDPETKIHALNLEVNDKYNKNRQKKIFIFLKDLSSDEGYFELIRADIKYKSELNSFGSFFIVFLLVYLVVNIRSVINLLRDY